MTTYISESEVSIKIGTKVIIDRSSLVVNANTRYGLVGPNGCGKTSLLNYIHDKLPEYLKTYVVDQHITFDSPDQTVLDFMLRANQKIYNTNQQINELENIDELDDGQLEEYNNLTSSREYDDYERYLYQTTKILNGLGITDHSNQVSLYSGGWRMRLAIAKALITKPDVLIMDEPTNHLDLNAVIWLSNFLSKYDKTLIITSHQIDFINNFSNVIWYIGSPDYKEPKLYTIKGKDNLYDKLLKMISDHNKNALTAFNKLESEVTKMKKNKSKIEIETYIKKTDIPRPPKPYEVKIGFPDIPRFQSEHQRVVKFENVSFGYNDDKLILDNSDFQICLKDRIVIVGSNGVGKTTLFKLCQGGEIEPISGNIITDSRIRIAYYHQQIVDNLPLDLSPIEYLQKLDSSLDVQKCRAYLGRIGLKKIDNCDPCIIPIDKLSGGQKARVSFCAIQVNNPHVILLDEPTNHLDIESIEGLIQGINDYKGGIVLITHDMYVINSINDIRIMELSNGKLNELKNGIEEYVERFNDDGDDIADDLKRLIIKETKISGSILQL